MPTMLQRMEVHAEKFVDSLGPASLFVCSLPSISINILNIKH